MMSEVIGDLRISLNQPLISTDDWYHGLLKNTISTCRSQWPRGRRRRSAVARLLRLGVRIPPGAWMFVCCECCVLSGRGLCDELITRPEESYRLCCQSAASSVHCTASCKHSLVLLRMGEIIARNMLS